MMTQPKIRKCPHCGMTFIIPRIEMLAEIAQGVQVDPKLVWAPTAFLKANNVSAWRDMPMWIPGKDETATSAAPSPNPTPAYMTSFVAAVRAVWKAA